MVKKDFDAAIRALSERGLIHSVQPVDHQVYKGDIRTGFGGISVARELAKLLPGQVFPAKTGAISWCCGRSKSDPPPHGVFLPTANYGSVVEARRIVAGFAPEIKSLRKWSVGGLARILLGLMSGQPKSAAGVALSKHYKGGFRVCEPGFYEETGLPFVVTNRGGRNLFEADHVTLEKNPDYRPGVTLFDAKSYYYSLLCRLPSYNLDLLPDGAVEFWAMSDRDAGTRADIESSIADCKPLRNALVGAMAGGSRPFRCFSSSGCPEGTCREIWIPPVEGPYHDAAQLVVRAGAELCHLEALTNKAVYATIDSVALLGGAAPTVLPHKGVTVAVKATGTGHICGVGSWRIGDQQTEFYQLGDTGYSPCAAPDLPKNLYSSAFL